MDVRWTSKQRCITELSIDFKTDIVDMRKLDQKYLELFSAKIFLPYPLNLGVCLSFYPSVCLFFCFVQ